MCLSLPAGRLRNGISNWGACVQEGKIGVCADDGQEVCSINLLVKVPFRKETSGKDTLTSPCNDGP